MTLARLLMNLMMSFRQVISRRGFAREQKSTGRHLEIGIFRMRLYITTIRNAFSNCRLYSWIRFIWQSKIVFGSTICPDVDLSQLANSTLASRLARRKPLRKALVLGAAFQSGKLREIGDPL